MLVTGISPLRPRSFFGIGYLGDLKVRCQRSSSRSIAWSVGLSNDVSPMSVR